MLRKGRCFICQAHVNKELTTDLHKADESTQNGTVQEKKMMTEEKKMQEDDNRKILEDRMIREEQDRKYFEALEKDKKERRKRIC